MKNLKIIFVVTILLLSCGIKAQVSLNVNIGSPPAWGPVGYTEARYYYLPDVEAYYDVQSAVFIYYGNGVWIRNAYLPSQYSGYDLYGGYKVVMTDYYGNTPYVNFVEYKKKYFKGYKGNSQKTIGMKPGNGNSKEVFRKEPSNKWNGQVNGNNNGTGNYKQESHGDRGNGGHGGGNGGGGNGHGKR